MIRFELFVENDEQSQMIELVFFIFIMNGFIIQFMLICCEECFGLLILYDKSSQLLFAECLHCQRLVTRVNQPLISQILSHA
jgi:hypothetical protein